MHVTKMLTSLHNSDFFLLQWLPTLKLKINTGFVIVLVNKSTLLQNVSTTLIKSVTAYFISQNHVSICFVVLLLYDKIEFLWS